MFKEKASEKLSFKVPQNPRGTKPTKIEGISTHFGEESSLQHASISSITVWLTRFTP
jgi:hypothetical protein